jgi:FlaA1/EpsC-like NDP-sugar epimerase
VSPSLETIDWRGFLSRPQLPSTSSKALELLCRAPILITGAGGSIGTTLAMRLASKANQLVLLESSESNLFSLQQELDNPATTANATFVLGSISDFALLDEIFSVHGPRLVFHAAAFKHVPLIEEQPLAAIANNIFGTATLIAAAAAHGARVVLLSTDKAVEPVSIMGVTKRVAEHIVLASAGIVLRLGNVLASRDSVAEVFASQIAAGGPLTVTDPAARRYFLTLEEAASLLLSAAAEPDPPALLVPELPAPQFIADLARFMARSLAPSHNIPIEFTRPRPGDKESEQLWSSSEVVRPVQTGGLLSIDSPSPPIDELQRALETLRAAVGARDTFAALASLRTLVPEFTPSNTAYAHCRANLKVTHE